MSSEVRSTVDAAGLEAVPACPACRATERDFLFEGHDWIYLRPGVFQLYACGKCGSIYPDPRPEGATLAAFYPEDEYYAYASPGRYVLFNRRELPARAWYLMARSVLSRKFGYRELSAGRWADETAGRLPFGTRRATFELDALLHPWRPDGALLDVGCGAGKYLDLMRALGWSRVVGVDISRTAVATARDVLGIEAYAGELEEVGLPEASFDAVSMSHTLEHVADPARLLAEVRRISKPGGRVAIVVPNVGGLVSRLMGEYWVGLDAPRHLISFTPEGLRSTVERSGLRLESLTSSGYGTSRVALFSLSRARHDPHSVYTDHLHRFGWRRRVPSAAIGAAGFTLCRTGSLVGEEISAVATR